MEGVMLSKEEYAEARDAFAQIVRDIEDLFVWFDPVYETPAEDEKWDDFLDRIGYYMTGSDYNAVQGAKRIFETLAGRNAARA